MASDVVRRPDVAVSQTSLRVVPSRCRKWHSGPHRSMEINSAMLLLCSHRVACRRPLVGQGLVDVQLGDSLSPSMSSPLLDGP